jgi:DNA polymerase-4
MLFASGDDSARPAPQVGNQSLPIASPCILHVRIEDFALMVALRDRPDLQGRAVVVSGDGEGRGAAAAVSSTARAEGIVPGMRLGLAEKLCPNLVVLPLDPISLRVAAREALERLGAYTPLIEPEWLRAPRKRGRPTVEDPARLARCFGVVLDVRGCERLFGSASAIAEQIAVDLAVLGYASRIGLAGTPALAAVASILARPGAPVQVPIGRERAFLEAIPLGVLEGLDADLRDYLRGLGVTRAGQLAKLPASALRRRFGEAGRAASEQAHGLADRLVIAPTAPPTMAAAYAPDDAMTDGPRLDRELSRLAGRLARDLAARGQSASRISLSVTCVGGRGPQSPAAMVSATAVVPPLPGDRGPRPPEARSLHLKQPVAGAPAVLARARELLIQIAPDRPVAVLHIELADLGSAPIQLSFPIAVGIGAPRQERLDAVAHRLRERFGPAAARRVHLVADAPLPEDGVAWEDYGRLPTRRPRPIAVQMDAEGRPTALRRGAGPWETVREVYTQWRIRTKWWAEPTHRHYYRLETVGGAVVDVYHEQRDGRWHLAATKD